MLGCGMPVNFCQRTRGRKNMFFCRVLSVFGRVSTGWFLGLVWLRRTFALQSNGLQHSDHKIHSFKMASTFPSKWHTRLCTRVCLSKNCPRTRLTVLHCDRHMRRQEIRREATGMWWRWKWVPCLQTDCVSKESVTYILFTETAQRNEGIKVFS